MVTTKLPVTLVLDNVRSLYNVGSIFRTADGVGLKKLILTGITPYPQYDGDTRMVWEQKTVTEKLHKTALGAEYTVDWKYENIENPATSKKLEGGLVVLEKTMDSVSLFDIDLTFPITLIVGNEVNGVSQEYTNVADIVVHVPMVGSKKSLNVASATAIALYELRRKFNESKPM